MLHLIKLAVGATDVDHMRAFQRRRAAVDPPLRHQTRSRPKREAELLAGGSLYWVIGGLVAVRQRLLELREDVWDDGRSCTGLVLDPELVEVERRPMAPFQGWRYLEAEAAPPDRRAPDPAAAELPESLREALRRVGLL